MTAHGENGNADVIVKPKGKGKKKLNVQNVISTFESRSDVTDFRTKNMYEAQIIASLGAMESGRRIHRYYCRTNSSQTLLQDANELLKASLSKDEESYFEKIENAPTLLANQDFECDLYIKACWSREPYKSILLFLNGSTQEVFQLGKEEVEDANINAKWVLIEVSESPRLLAHKLYQLERAILLLPGAVSEFKLCDVGALVILLNGKLDEAKRAISYVQDCTKLQMFRFPVYVGWVPSRNIYSMIWELDQKFELRTDKAEKQMMQMEQKLDKAEKQMMQMEEKLDIIIRSLDAKISQ